MKRKIIAVCGPTASGKSALAIEIARALNSEILSCDSMQIYRGMDIGTAKEPPDRRVVAHRLIDIADPEQAFSVSDYQRLAHAEIERLHAQEKIPVLAGGTGLYLESILYPLQLGAHPDPQLRAQLQQDLERCGAEAMHERLRALDAQEADRVHPNNTKRVLRALEICLGGNARKSDADDKTRDPLYDALVLAPDYPRDELYRRINRRVDDMFANGLEDEVRGLIDRGVDFGCQSMQAIGYKEFQPYFAGTIDRETLIDTIRKNTRHYAKRQISWLRRYDFVQWLPPDCMTRQALKSVATFTNSVICDKE